MGRSACTELQCLYSIAIPLLPLWVVRPVQSLSACTVQLYLYSPQYLYSRAIPLLPSVPVQYSYTFTPPMGRTACTEPQCLYKGALYLYLLYLCLRTGPLILCFWIQFILHIFPIALTRFACTTTPYPEHIFFSDDS